VTQSSASVELSGLADAIIRLSRHGISADYVVGIELWQMLLLSTRLTAMLEKTHEKSRLAIG
jgi:hypothetical protein